MRKQTICGCSLPVFAVVFAFVAVDFAACQDDEPSVQPGRDVPLAGSFLDSVPEKPLDTSTKRRPSEKEIRQLFGQLDDPDDRTRERAVTRLVDAGRPALDIVQWALPMAAAAQPPDPRNIRALQQIIVEAQERNGIASTRVNGVEFQPFADSVWRVPSPGKCQDINLGIRITNHRKKKVRVSLLMQIAFEIRGPTGAIPERVGVGYDSPSRDWGSNAQTPPLGKGESFTVDFFEVKLCKSGDGNDTCLLGEDGLTKFRYKRLSPGRYFYRFMCGNGVESPQEGCLFWKGQAAIPYVAIEIK